MPIEHGALASISHSAPRDQVPKCVLLVEDDEDNRNIYRTILRHFGYAVLEAGDGREGIRVAREAIPDLILMDISIPAIDGWTAIQSLKADASTCDIPIFALTAHARAADCARATELGCDGFLTKPITPADVLAKVNLRLRSPESAHL